jgi:hypothetical protein
VVPGYVPEGLSILAGRQKLGKTWLALDWAIAVACRGMAMGSVDCEQGDVLYIDLENDIDLENGHRRIQSRIKMLFPDQRHLPDLSRLEWVNDAPALNKGFLDALNEWHSSVAIPRLVVVDVLQRIKPAGNANQNAYESDYVALPGFSDGRPIIASLSYACIIPARAVPTIRSRRSAAQTGFLPVPTRRSFSTETRTV